MSRTARTTIVLALMIAGFVGYGRAFDVLAARLRPPQKKRAELDLRPSTSVSARRAAELAERVFGKHHWTAGSNVTRYYNVERGYWMYWGSLDFPEDQDRKRITFEPFAVIWESDDDGRLQVLSGDRALVDFDQPFNLFGGGSKPSVIHAKIEGIDEPVLIIDDKGTADDPDDDLVVSMPYAEYFEQEMLIRCDDRVRLIDQDVQVVGVNLNIDLRPPSTRGGVPMAEVITLQKDVKITSEDVGSTGILPGAATPEQQATAVDAEGAPVAGPPKTPATLTCDGSMRLELPRPRMPVRVGPPAPAGPTIVDFNRNVVVERGAVMPDRIIGDHLRAILIPRPAPPVAEGEDPDAGAAAGPGGLTMLQARVDGHAVWLESAAEHVKVHGNELVFKKPEDGGPEVSEFLADPGRQIEFERVELDEDGRVASVVTIWSTDATTQGDPEGLGRMRIVAGGPGRLEMRSDRDRPVDRTVTWRAEMIIEMPARDDARPANEPARTYITLNDLPVIDDPKQLELVARDSVVLCLERPLGPAASATAEGEAKEEGPAYRLKWVTAKGDVHMNTPEKAPDPAVVAAMIEAGRPVPKGEARRELNARDQLDVVFTYPEPAPAATAPAPMTDLGLGRADAVVVADGKRVSPFRLASQQVEVGREDRDAMPPPADEVPGGRETPAVPTEVVYDPPFQAEADHVWALVELPEGGGGVGSALGGEPGAGGGGERDVREVRLRGDVFVHQDPKPGEERGLDAQADMIDLFNPGPGRLRMLAHGDTAPAVVGSSAFLISGSVLGVDQATDYAFAEGAGRLWQMSGGNAPIAGIGAKPEEADERKPLLISWTQGMTFHGTYPDPDGRPGPARALFLGQVRTSSGDAGLICEDWMEAVFDRAVDFDEALPAPGRAAVPGGRAPAPVPEGEEAQPDLDTLFCFGDVRLRSLVRDPEKPAALSEMREAFGDSITYDRPSDTFWIDGVGTVLVTSVGKDPKPAARRAGEDPPKRRRAPLNKLRVDFSEGLEGQLGQVGEAKQVARFKGDARALYAEVGDFRTPLEFDRMPAGAVRLDAQTIYVEHTPETPGVSERNYLKAFESAQARTDDKTIQGDEITYDSVTGLFYARGNPVVIASQRGLGQPTSRALARAVKYNALTDYAETIHPGAAIFVRPDTGGRYGPQEAEDPEEEEEEKRPEPRLPARNDIERKGFTGR